MYVVIGEWVAAVLGSIFATCSDLNHPSTTLVELCFFVAMGAGGSLLLMDEILAEFSGTMLTLLSLTAFFYLFGIAFFVLGEYKPIYHVIWHVCVVFAAAFHWFNVFFFVVTSDIDGVSPTKAAVSDMCEHVSNAAVMGQDMAQDMAQSLSSDLSDLMRAGGGFFSNFSNTP
jgi:hypothetical protein